MWSRCIDVRAWGVGGSGAPIWGAERLVLDRLRGREKLKLGRVRWLPLLEVSELRDGERGRDERFIEDMGDWGMDMALPEESLRGLEKVDPAFELL